MRALSSTTNVSTSNSVIPTKTKGNHLLNWLHDGHHCKHTTTSMPELGRHICARREREGTCHTLSRTSMASGTPCVREGETGVYVTVKSTTKKVPSNQIMGEPAFGNVREIRKCSRTKTQPPSSSISSSFSSSFFCASFLARNALLARPTRRCS